MDGRYGAILKADGEYLLRYERRLNHPPQTVWEAITGPGAMSRWFDTTEMPAELKVGSVIRFYHAVLDRWSEGEVTALEPGRLIEWMWKSTFGSDNPIRWEITPAPEGCVLVMSQRIDDPSILGRTAAGWQVCLDRMEAMIDRAPDPGGMGAWAPLFEHYSAVLTGMGVTDPQQGAPPRPPPKS